MALARKGLYQPIKALELPDFIVGIHLPLRDSILDGHPDNQWTLERGKTYEERVQDFYVERRQRDRSGHTHGQVGSLITAGSDIMARYLSNQRSPSRGDPIPSCRDSVA
jgi:hypothetical protein